MNINNEVPLMKHETLGTGETLILVGGGLTGWLSWIPHTEKLASSRKTIRLQLHSVEFGLSGKQLPANYSVKYEVTALGKTLDDLEIQQADFAAWSYGAAITLSYALHHPDRIRSLTLIEPPAIWVIRSRGELSQDVLKEQKFMQTLANQNISEDQLVQFTYLAGLIPRDQDPRTIPPWESWMKHRQSLRMGDVPYQHDDRIELVQQFKKPVLFVKGQGSSAYYHEIIDILAEELPDARIESYPGGHAPHLISMQPFMERFTRFLSDHN